MAAFDPTAPVETWHPIPSVPGVELSNYYRVRRWVSHFGYVLPSERAPVYINVLTKKPKGYLVFSAYCTFYYVHRCVKEVVLGRRLRPGEMVLHKDDVKTNNHPRNLRLGTAQDNADDAKRNGRTARGARAGASMLTEAAVAEIRGRSLAGEGTTRLAEEFGVHRSAVARVVSRKTWRHVS